MPQSSIIAFFLLAGLVIVVVIRGSLPAYASIVGLNSSNSGSSLLSGLFGAAASGAGAVAGATAVNATAPGISALGLPGFGGGNVVSSIGGTPGLNLPGAGGLY